MKKRAYRKTDIQDFKPSDLVHRAGPQPLILAIDIAKHDMVAAVADRQGQVLSTLAWKHPAQTPLLLDCLCTLRDHDCSLEAVMESSASYGDTLRHQLRGAAVPVFQVSGKRVHDAKVVYDGTASLHDAKCAAIIAKLHVDGRTSLWNEKSEAERDLKAAVSTMDLFQHQYLRLIHQLEGRLARHWPEVTQYLELTSASLLGLIARIGGPKDVASDPDTARDVLLKVSRRLLHPDKVERVLQSAQASIGIPLTLAERHALMTLAAEAHRALRAWKGAKLHLERISADSPAKALAPAVGKATAAVLVSEVGDPMHFSSARAYLKAYGLSLKEKSSGKLLGRLRISRFGSGRARQWLWLAVHRWRDKDPIAQAWYQRKVQRDGGRKARAAVALMRKLAMALFHVARGANLDSAKLFDIRKLNLPA